MKQTARSPRGQHEAGAVTGARGRESTQGRGASVELALAAVFDEASIASNCSPASEATCERLDFRTEDLIRREARTRTAGARCSDMPGRVTHLRGVSVERRWCVPHPFDCAGLSCADE